MPDTRSVYAGCPREFRDARNVGVPEARRCVPGGFLVILVGIRDARRSVPDVWLYFEYMLGGSSRCQVGCER